LVIHEAGGGYILSCQLCRHAAVVNYHKPITNHSRRIYSPVCFKILNRNQYFIFDVDSVCNVPLRGLLPHINSGGLKRTRGTGGGKHPRVPSCVTTRKVYSRFMHNRDIPDRVYLLVKINVSMKIPGSPEPEVAPNNTCSRRAHIYS